MQLQNIDLTSVEIKELGEIFQNGIQELPSDLPSEYISLIEETNGGFTENQVFHFFGINGPLHHNVLEWNKSDLWKKHYGLDDQCFVFAEDLFGDQYYFKRGKRGNAIYFLNSCKGKSHFAADRLEALIDDLIDDCEEMMVEQLDVAKQFFEQKDVKWRPFKHLSYIHPPILSGSDDDPDNIELCDSITNLSFNGQLIEQLKNVPEGTAIKEIQVDKKTNTVKLVY